MAANVIVDVMVIRSYLYKSTGLSTTFDSSEDSEDIANDRDVIASPRSPHSADSSGDASQPKSLAASSSMMIMTLTPISTIVPTASDSAQRQTVASS